MELYDKHFSSLKMNSQKCTKGDPLGRQGVESLRGRKKLKSALNPLLPVNIVLQAIKDELRRYLCLTSPVSIFFFQT